MELNKIYEDYEYKEIYTDFAKDLFKDKIFFNSTEL